MTDDTNQPPAEAPPTDDPRVEPLAATTPPRVETTPAPRSHERTLALLNALERLAKWVVTSLMRPKVRLVAVGTILIVIGVFFIDHSVWTFPLVVVGVVMIMVAWVGSRLEGRFGIEWNEDGAGFEMQARFKARAHALPAPAVSSSHAGPPAATNFSATGVDDTVIEGEAHTIEIDVEELRALVEAAERGTMSSATATGTPVSWQGRGADADRGVKAPGG
jgi:hypothetical protein